jgi:bifunctional DNA-binding transcriptional regulator/antitoxin component of YhaV-PrlF toxin-antitoxin module
VKKFVDEIGLEEFMKAVKVETDGSIKLPKEMLRLFPTASELAVWTEGDTIVLQPLKPSQIAERVPEKEMPLKDIAAEVQRMRRETHRRSGKNPH